MARAAPIQTSFNAGEFAPELTGRVDIGKYQSACERLENFIPLVQGPARRRGGTRFVAEVKDSTDRTWLGRFEFNTEQAYVIEFGDQYLRFFTDNGSLLAGSPAAYNGATAYVVGDLVSDAGVNYYCIAATTGNAPPNATYWYAMPATGEFEMPTPWAVADLTNADGSFALNMVQSGDIIYIVHPDYAPRKLNRFGATTWTITAFEPDGGPFEDYDPDQATTVYASAATGSVTVTASAAIFVAADVGRLFYIEQKKANAITMWEPAKAVGAGVRRRSAGKTYVSVNAATTGAVKPTHVVGSEYDGDTGVQWTFEDPGYGWGVITAIGGGGTTATVTVQSALPNQAVLVGNATTRWAFGDWCSENGYPSHVTFFRNRLVFARAADRKIWFSVAGDYENFRDRDDGGEVVADMSITLLIESDQSNQIQYMVPSDALIVGTAAGEHVISEQTDSDPFGPANYKVDKVSDYGARGVQPVKVGGQILFVQRSGRKLREITFDALSDGYKSEDMNVLAPHMVPKGVAFRQLAYQKEPYSVIWAARDDGALRGFTYNREQYTEPPYGGWHRHTLGGSGLVESIVCVPSPAGDRDDLWLIVRRTINGATKRYVEYMVAEWESGDAQEDAFYVDCGLTYNGAAATTISGLDHLEGAAVDVLADGATHPQCTVASGSITLSRSASVVQVGLPCPAKLATMKFEAGSRDGTAQGKTQRISRVVLRLMDTLGGSMGPTEANLDAIQFRSASDPMDSAPAVFTGDKSSQGWPGGYEQGSRVWYVNDQPLPATVVAVMPQVVTQDRG